MTQSTTKTLGDPFGQPTGAARERSDVPNSGPDCLQQRDCFYWFQSFKQKYAPKDSFGKLSCAEVMYTTLPCLQECRTVSHVCLGARCMSPCALVCVAHCTCSVVVPCFCALTCVLLYAYGCSGIPALLRLCDLSPLVSPQSIRLLTLS